ncbi:glycerophosphodiester phosphodiesterase family protein [Auritidibacter ignavus]|uniref:Glycerophosphodiester phosphodiesterase family protein n=1 Tax=Auritidibacter ignavus TaxID=678932 RepID=A0AAJ6AI10_9MICC|nr:glycerophosphodiester phosphodiesterase family protein [Auritidibacter ignavus]WGH82242.1 glycerophosphodiester phosphodiesterase family protein [Auritidibacter ignavus]WGH84491.1 glycerophosphodiester phosphodiesterase family protein [Auritidibacter ignavus]WGH93816.1 glycerophosphodiester phosphodiesterase family protein [Auritidibacter ignavus]
MTSWSVCGSIATLCASLLGTLFVNPAFSSSPKDFDIQAHRGGLGLYSESSPAAFANALELGVTTLELDTHVTEDGKVVIWHDRQIHSHLCRDTTPAFSDDPDYPYVDRYISELTLQQLQTLECGYQPHPDHPDQQIAPGSIMELSDLFDLVHEYNAYDTMMNIETKVEAGAPDETQPRDIFVPTVLKEIEASGLSNQVTIQSFDWGALKMVHELDPSLPTVALTNFSFFELDQPGASPWLGGLDADDYDGDFVAMAQEIGVEAISPLHGEPQDGALADPDYEMLVTREMVDEAHEAGLKVIPWTVNDPETMARLIDLGVDGMITDRPDLLREVLAMKNFQLPAPVHRPGYPDFEQPSVDASATEEPTGPDTLPTSPSATVGPAEENAGSVDPPTGDTSSVSVSKSQAGSVPASTAPPESVAKDHRDKAIEGHEHNTGSAKLAHTGAGIWLLISSATFIVILGIVLLWIRAPHNKRH